MVIWWEILKFSNKMQYVGYVLKRFLLSQLSTVKLLTKVYVKDLLKREGRQLKFSRSSNFDKLKDTFTNKTISKKYDLPFIKTGKTR